LFDVALKYGIKSPDCLKIVFWNNAFEDVGIPSENNGICIFNMAGEIVYHINKNELMNFCIPGGTFLSGHALGWSDDSHKAWLQCNAGFLYINMVNKGFDFYGLTSADLDMYNLYMLEGSDFILDYNTGDFWYTDSSLPAAPYKDNSEEGLREYKKWLRTRKYHVYKYDLQTKTNILLETNIGLGFHLEKDINGVKITELFGNPGFPNFPQN
jgi:hypothetical protein